MFLNYFPPLRYIYTCGHVTSLVMLEMKYHRLLLTEAVTAVITTGPKLSKLHKQNIYTHTHTDTRETTQAQKRTHTQPWAAFAILGTHYMVVCLITV